MTLDEYLAAVRERAEMASQPNIDDPEARVRAMAERVFVAKIDVPRLLAIIEAQRAELEKAERIIERAHITVPHPLGWSAIEAKWKSGGYG